MDDTVVPLLLGSFAAALATIYGALPERIDVMFVFGAYGVGSILGEVVAARRPSLDPVVYGRRLGGWLMALTAAMWLHEP